jgi:hypothetical protein
MYALRLLDLMVQIVRWDAGETWCEKLEVTVVG